MTDKELTAAQMLFEARTSGRRKRELSTISKLLCIREEYLAALETGNYNNIPEIVYILGFARNYAMELGLDPDIIADKIKAEMGLVETESMDVIDADEELRPIIKNTEKEEKTEKNIFFEKLLKYMTANWKLMTAALVGIIVIIISISFIVSINSDTDSSDSNAVIMAPVVEPDYKQTVREKFGTENAATAKIVLQATAESWVKIEDARNNTIFSRVLVAGDVYFVPDSDSLRGTFGNAGGLDIWVNGKLAPKLGALNERKNAISISVESLTGASAE